MTDPACACPDICYLHGTFGRVGSHEEFLAEVDDMIDISHIRLKDGRCVISVNGQGHLPCEAHPPLP